MRLVKIVLPLWHSSECPLEISPLARGAVNAKTCYWLRLLRITVPVLIRSTESKRRYRENINQSWGTKNNLGAQKGALNISV